MKISGLQIFWLMFSMEIGMTLLLAMSSAILEAKQDAWISFMIAGVIGLILTLLATKLSLLYPGQTFIEYSQTILGKWLGKVIVIPYFVVWYYVPAVSLRQSSDFFFNMNLFTKTPILVLIFAMLITVIYVTHQGGIEGIARCSEIFGVIVFLGIIITFVFNVNNIKSEQLLPVYADSGWRSILKGVIHPAGYLGESVVLMIMLMSFMANPIKGLSCAMWGVGIASVLASISVLQVVLTFGPLVAAKMWYPYFEMARYISLMDFIQNVDILIVIIWILSVFVKVSLYLFIASYATAQWMGIKNWRRIIWVVALIVLIISVAPPNIAVSSVDLPIHFWNTYVIPVNLIGIPLLLWIVGVIRKQVGQSKG